LDTAGYGGRVRVVQARTGDDLPKGQSFDVIVVSLTVSQIPPLWQRLLAPGGRLVVPLRLNGISRSIAFRRAGAHLVSVSIEPVTAAEDDHPASMLDIVQVNEERRPDAGATIGASHGEPQQPTGISATGASGFWSGIVRDDREQLADLHLWLACFSRKLRWVVSSNAAGMNEERDGICSLGIEHDGSTTRIIQRTANQDGGGVELGAAIHGTPDAAARLISEIQAWGSYSRRSQQARITFHPSDSYLGPESHGRMFVKSATGVLCVDWTVGS
jgi:protein-L-isoaspartate(D-aspartate) O-methyltransferase